MSVHPPHTKTVIKYTLMLTGVGEISCLIHFEALLSWMGEGGQVPHEAKSTLINQTHIFLILGEQLYFDVSIYQ